MDLRVERCGNAARVIGALAVFVAVLAAVLVPAALPASAQDDTFDVDGGPPAPVCVAAGTTPAYLGNGPGLHQFLGPVPLAVDEQGFIYIGDTGNKRIVRWSPGAVQGEAVISPSSGSVFDEVYAIGLAVDAAGVVYALDALDSDRLTVEKRLPGASESDVVAGNAGRGLGLDQFRSPTDIAVDDDGKVYVADSSNHRVVRWDPGAEAGTIVAGTGEIGDGLGELAYPNGVALDDDGNLYIADTGNHRVVRWEPGAEAGTVVAGTGDSGYSLDSVTPTKVAVDRAGAIYIVEAAKNRVVRWDVGATSGTVVADTKTAFPGFDPGGVAVDDFGNVYMTDSFTNLVMASGPVCESIELVRNSSSVTIENSDGSAFPDSRTVFKLTHVLTGETTLVAVDGADDDDERASFEIAVPLGEYRIETGGAQVFPSGSYRARDIEPAEFTLGAPGDTITVGFGIEVEYSPFDVIVEAVGDTSVELSWVAADGVDVDGYDVRVTEGSVAASDADDGDGVDVESDATSVVVDGLNAGTEYTFAVFATSNDGEALESRSVAVTTSDPGSGEPAYALAPNTIVVSDFDSLNAELVGPDLVSVTLGAAATSRSSYTEIPGVDEDDVRTGCVVGLPLLVPTEAAGEEAFYGLIESCSDDGTTAVVNADVPLAAVVPFLYIDGDLDGDGTCFDATGNDIDFDEPACQELHEAALEADVPEGLATGDVEVTLLWSTGDDLDIKVTNPDGETISFASETNPGADKDSFGGFLDRDDTGDNTCQSVDQRAEHIVWETDPPEGTYTVDVSAYVQDRSPCSQAPQAQLRVSVGGEIVVDQSIEVGTTDPITFDVTAAANRPRNRMRYNATDPAQASSAQALSTEPLSGSAAVSGSASSAAGMALGAARPGVECEPDGKVFLNPQFNVTGYKNVRLFKLQHGSMKWIIKAGVRASINPKVSVEASLACSLDLPSAVIQLTTTPVPLNLELKPVVEGSVSGELELTGPELSVSFGISTNGHVSASVKKCKVLWVNIPCGIRSDVQVNARPFGTLNVGPASISAKAEIAFGVGVEANIGVGVKNAFVTAKAGFAVTMKPLVAAISIEETFTLDPAPPNPLLPDCGDYTGQRDTTSVFRCNALMRTNGWPPPGEWDYARYLTQEHSRGDSWAFRPTNFHSGVRPDDCPYGQVHEVVIEGGTWPNKTHEIGRKCAVAICMEPTQATINLGAKQNHGALSVGDAISIGDYQVFCTSFRCLATGEVMHWDMDTAPDEPVANGPEFYTPEALQKYGEYVVAWHYWFAVLEQCPPPEYWVLSDFDVYFNQSSPVLTAKICASVGIRAELEVDFSVESFVLGWGKESRIHLWDGEFDYPGAKFEIGDC